jgi:ribonuclease P/MRP protein subunit POP5
MKEKPLLPTLREKKRYLVYEILSDADFDAKVISTSIKDAMHELFGMNGVADAGLMFMDNKFNTETQRGFVRVSAQSLDALRASFTFIHDIKGRKAIVRSVIASGMIAKAEAALSAS